MTSAIKVWTRSVRMNLKVKTTIKQKAEKYTKFIISVTNYLTLIYVIVKFKVLVEFGLLLLKGGLKSNSTY